MTDAWVLWAEDDPIDQALIRSCLEGRRQPRVEMVDDGMLVLERVRQALPHRLILDLRMPRMDGLSTLRQLRADPRTRRLPVSVFSSGSVPEEVDEIRSLGVTDVRQKPIQYEEFRQAVEAMLAGT